MLAAALAMSLAGAPVKVDLWNDLPADVTVSSPAGTPTVIPHGKDVTFTVAAGGKALTIAFMGCDYPFAWPAAMDGFVDEQTGAVRLYLSNQVELYIVPTDLILQTPPDFLDPRQPNGFPIYPGPETCRKG